MNNYHIHEIIGRGRQSKVYKARLKQSLEYVVVKACSKDLKPRVLQEVGAGSGGGGGGGGMRGAASAPTPVRPVVESLQSSSLGVKVLNSLAHPNLLRFHTWYETQNHLWVILEYCVGGDLLSLLRSDGRLPEASVLRLGRDLSAALQHLHTRGILHCDLKPSNILLDENGRVRLGGLGISRRSEVVQRQLATLPNGLREMQQGSPYYLAPEAVRTPGFYTTASDLWALGCILYECASGRPPFAAATTQQLNALILGHHPQLPTGLSPELEGLIERLLDKDPLSRCTWPELCGHPFWGASPPSLQPLPDDPVLLKLLEERGGGGDLGGGGGGGRRGALAARHRASGSGSSLGGEGEFAANGVGTGGAQDTAHSNGGSGGSGRLGSASGSASASASASGEYRGGATQPPNHTPPRYPEVQVSLLDLGGKDPALRLRAANLLGLLVRHASSVNAGLAEAGACRALAAAVRQMEDAGLQRRAAAALGELLFYADSQHRDAAGGCSGASGGPGTPAQGLPPWDLTTDAVQRLAGLLQAGQDEVAQHYAAKALENVFGLGGPWAQQLASAETAGRLAQLVDSKLPDVLRGTAASALCRLLRCQPGCLASFVEAGGLDLVAAGLADGSPRVQQACVTILAQLLCSRQLAAGVGELCLGDEAVLEGLNGLLDNAAEMLQAKALVALGLLCRSPAGLVAVVSWHGLLPQIERLCSKERQGSAAGSSEQYMAAAVAGFLQQLSGNAVPLLRQAAAAARAATASAGAAGGGGSGGAGSGGGVLQPLEALQQLLSSVAFRQVVVCDGLITGLADLLTRELSSSGSSAASALHQELKASAAKAPVSPSAHGLNAIDAICSHPELLIDHYATVLSHLLPALSAAVASQRETPDTRFCCLKLLCDVFVNEPRLYISATESEHTTADSGIANQLIDAAVAQYVLPLMPALFADEDPMPL
ncbi:hypothetical protein CHLNCDRAFT_141668 [Chlorella variabilis]|uniref:Protein kinase domain-containing protein n=1 Tax=Chlorella variabilis TaxID=554065 RepID=E1ZTC0_CHLVA|nr:hypothetical protein CHLNCDRAFT_141668 [Chlorella variabilis]EFN50873.1 hypothetical protein CHLNCDRAFT_141668 [Chlorella variabilis]|eukprot:XP_005842975.1 hypothetical protein CHLNCDRAFT_141668 [Chlorella variabilis]